MDVVSGSGGHGRPRRSRHRERTLLGLDPADRALEVVDRGQALGTTSSIAPAGGGRP